jgi:hypothetical protein
MPFPAGWPPRVASGRHSLRFYATGTATAAFADSAFLFADQAGANPFTPLPYVPPGGEPGKSGPTVLPPTPSGTGQDAHDVNTSISFDTIAAPVQQEVPHKMMWSFGIIVANDSPSGGPDLEYSIDGTNVAGLVKAGELHAYDYRHEAGICFRGLGAVFRCIAW